MNNFNLDSVKNSLTNSPCGFLSRAFLITCTFDVRLGHSTFRAFLALPNTLTRTSAVFTLMAESPHTLLNSSPLTRSELGLPSTSESLMRDSTVGPLQIKTFWLTFCSSFSSLILTLLLVPVAAGFSGGTETPTLGSLLFTLALTLFTLSTIFSIKLKSFLFWELILFKQLIIADKEES